MVMTIAVMILAACGTGRTRPWPKVAVVGEPEVVFDWSTQACESSDAPDGPARAFRDTQGNVRLVAPQHVNRSASGPSLSTVTRSCTVIYRGSLDDDPARFDDRGWLMSPYTFDGRTVYALVHNEYHGHLRPEQCPRRTYRSCWQNAVTHAISTDGGASFRLAPPGERLVAGPSVPYRGDQTKPTGMFNPSNIVRHGDAYYTLVLARPPRARPSRVCLLRTMRLDTPGSWRAWDGKGFGAEPDDTCEPVGRATFFASVGSVVRHEPSGTFIAVQAGRATDASGLRRSGVFYATSPDLVHWSERALAWSVPVWGEGGCEAPWSIGYPALLDEASKSRNFETVGGSASLYYTRFNLEGCRIGADRDLVRVPLRIGP